MPLSERTPSSYDIKPPLTAVQVADHLARRGWQQIDTKSQSELFRMRKGTSGLVLIWKGTALIQGSDHDIGHRALGDLLEDCIADMFSGATFTPKG